MLLDPTDHYAVLGLDPDCTADQIRAAYRLLAKQHHPDVNNGAAEAAARTQALNAAYAVLGNAAQRKLYDQQRRVEKTSSSRPAAMRPDIRKDVSLRISELLRGTQLDVRINDPGGGGKTEVYTLDIPPQTPPGTNFQLARQGGGWVRIKVRVQPDFRFKVRGTDLRCDLRIRAQRAAQGGTESVRGPLGNLLRISIPRGVSRGAEMRIAGEGLPKPRGGRGDLLVRILYAPQVQISRIR